MKEYVDEILLRLGGGVVAVEIEDNHIIEKAINAALRELRRYVNFIKYSTIKYAPVIDLSPYNVQSITQVFRSRSSAVNYEFPDAIYLSMYKYPGSVNTMTDYRTYLRMRQIKQTLVTDMNFRWDEMNKRLYVQASYPQPPSITIAYVPRVETVEELSSAYWEDILLRLALALCKEMLGRIRGKYIINNALYNLDFDNLLQEGREELSTLREYLQTNADIMLPID